MKFKITIKKGLIAAVAITALLAIFVFASQIPAKQVDNSEKTAPSEPVQQATEKPVKIKILEEEVRTLPLVLYTGTLEPQQTLDVSFDKPGTVKNLTVRQGDRIKQGQHLVSLEKPLNSQEIVIAEARIDQLKINRDQIETNYERTKQLLDAGAATKVALENLKTQLDSIEQDIIQAEMAKELKEQRDHKQAPFSGVVLKKLVNEEEYISPGKPVLIIGEISQLKVKVEVPLTELDLWSVGKEVAVKANGQTRPGIIYKRHSFANTGTGKVDIEIQVANKYHEWLAGEIAQVIPPSKELKGMFIPIEVVFYDYESYVFVLENAKAVRRSVQLLMPVAEEIQVQGLNDGDKLVVAGMERLHPGDVVTVIGDKAYD